MPLPREVLPGRTYMVTRRCCQRQFLLRPDQPTNNAFIYCLAVAAKRAGIVVLFTSAQSNHHHTGIYDPLGTYPDFIEHFHKLLAKCMNSLRGRCENFWSSEQTSVVRLVDAGDVLDKMVYALTNPVKDNLVAEVIDWPGVNAFDALTHGGSLAATRPAFFFREDGPMPDAVTLTFGRPPQLSEIGADEFTSMLRARVQAVEGEAAVKRHTTGRSVLGKLAVLGQDWHGSPSSHAPRGKLSPRVAAKNQWSRIEALGRNRQFVSYYRTALAALRKGLRDVLFPAGTFWLRRFAAVVCEPYPAEGLSGPA